MRFKNHTRKDLKKVQFKGKKDLSKKVDEIVYADRRHCEEPATKQSEVFANTLDCHVGLRPPRNDER